ncbi:MAG: extracellular solute-binding protein, partial [Oscillospiraceae bacterium]|nr:extracellular solute-binding protein [Oscillospiraceae bacterium]
MKSTSVKRVIAGLSALSVSLMLAGCGGGDSGNNGGGNAPAPAQETTTTAATTTAATVEVNTITMSTEQMEAVNSASAQLRDIELENKEIKWLCHWDLNPDSTGKSIPVPLSMFQEKYDGKIKWYQTTWENRYSDLSTYVLGGEGIDFFQRDESSLPKCIVSGMFEPIDEYIDIDSPLYDDVRAAMDIYSFKGKHYAFVNGVTADAAVIYSAKTIEENGLDDPWELYQDGEWNWDTFSGMLEEFCDADNELYGLDGWWSERPLYLSAGVPAISSVDGKMSVNLKDPTLEKAQNWLYSLYQKGLVMDKSLFDWSTKVQFMGEGKEL